MLARRSCQFCARRKIRCSKELPICGSCKSHQRNCVFDKRALPEDLSNEEANAHLIQALVSASPAATARGNYRSSIRFLDQSVFVRSHLSMQADHVESLATPASVRTLLGNSDALQDMATYYFQASSPWLPIISKRRVFDRMLNPILAPISADANFLLLCMLVLTKAAPSARDWSDEYYAAIQFRDELELAGALSLNILQGCLLLCVYEQGNAIYPAAHLSIGRCLKQATALGLGWTYHWADSASSADQIEAEEGRRVWWAIYVLERIQALGDPTQILSVPEPQLGALLPWPEAEWDSCDIPSTKSTLSSPSSKVGRFSAIVQASFLLSSVYAHVSHSFTDKSLRNREVQQLHHTLGALLRYTVPEVDAEVKVMCYFRAIGTAAMIILLEPYLDDTDDPSFVEFVRSAMDDAIESTASSARVFIEREATESRPGAVSPFILPWLYIAARKCVQRDREKSFALMETAIARLEWRWKAANAYQELLAAVKVMNSV